VPTHQSLSGSTDEELLQRMVATHPERFGEPYWTCFEAHVGRSLPDRPAVLDLGCGPGLFLRDVSQRHPAATLFGYDLTPAMIAHGQQLAYAGAKPTLMVHDVTRQALPHDDGSVHLVSMTAVLHVLDEPLPVLAEIRRVLAPQGAFALHDWIRQPLADYLEFRRTSFNEPEPEGSRRGYRLFAVHNKYTTDDWLWLLATAGFTVRHHAQVRPAHRLFIAAPC
jgi:SAM-dependent methyltransferase